MRLHPWHEIPLGADAPDELNLVVEVPRKTTTKYELDLDLGILRIDRIMHPPVPYPANYGFLPQMLDEDGDPLDAMVLMQNAAEPLTVLSARHWGRQSHRSGRERRQDHLRPHRRSEVRRLREH